MKYLLLMLLSITVHAESERYHQNEWCTMGETEVILDDKTRVDCLTNDFAIEFDFARKWQEAIGQSLHYGFMTDRRPGIVLIMKDKTDIKYWNRMQKLIWDYKLPIQTWMINEQDK